MTTVSAEPVVRPGAMVSLLVLANLAVWMGFFANTGTPARAARRSHRTTRRPSRLVTGLGALVAVVASPLAGAPAAPPGAGRRRPQPRRCARRGRGRARGPGGQRTSSASRWAESAGLLQHHAGRVDRHGAGSCRWRERHLGWVAPRVPGGLGVLVTALVTCGRASCRGGCGARPHPALRVGGRDDPIAGRPSPVDLGSFWVSPRRGLRLGVRDPVPRATGRRTGTLYLYFLTDRVRHDPASGLLN
jgi:hypothetical protein